MLSEEKMMKNVIYICFFIFLIGCSFDEGFVGYQNSRARKEAKKYWKIKEETVVPLKETPLEQGTRVTYSKDGKTFITVNLYYYQHGLEFHKFNYPDEEERIQKKYEKLLNKWKITNKENEVTPGD